MKNNENLGIGIANATWVLSIALIIIFTDATPWLLVIPIIFSWDFIKDKNNGFRLGMTCINCGCDSWENDDKYKSFDQCINCSFGTDVRNYKERSN